MTRTYFRLNQGSALLEAKKPGEKDDGVGRYHGAGHHPTVPRT